MCFLYNLVDMSNVFHFFVCFKYYINICSSNIIPSRYLEFSFESSHHFKNNFKLYKLFLAGICDENVFKTMSK